jgi:DNA-binding MarR family transcriptional regulator
MGVSWDRTDVFDMHVYIERYLLHLNLQLFDTYTKLVYNTNMVLPNNPPNPNDYAGFLIWKTSNQWEKYINNLLLPFGLIQSEICHLISIIQLVQIQKTVTQVELSRSIGTTPMSTSKILRGLEKKGFISRIPGKDTRSKTIQITEQGMEILISTAPILAKADGEFFASSNPQQLIKQLQEIQK